MSDVQVVQLPATPHAPKTARAIVNRLVQSWDLLELADDAELVVSELVTNAVQHAPSRERLELEVTRRPGGVRIALADGSSVEPVAQELNPQRPSGRGVAIITAVADDWGVAAHDGGKQVWVELVQAGPSSRAVGHHRAAG